MTDAHKAAIATGRVETKAVNDYLEALRSHRPRRGRQRNAESIEARLAVIGAKLQDAGAVESLKLLQERSNLKHELAAMSEARGPDHYVDAFVKHAASFGSRHGITASVWREFGVQPAVLKRAGIR
jgi:hypothetical protein